MALASISSLPASCFTRARVEDRAAALFRGGIAISDRTSSSGVDGGGEEGDEGLLATAGLSRRALGLLTLLLLLDAAALGRAAAGSICERESEKGESRRKG